MQGELVFCEVALYFVSDSLHMTPACSWWSDYHAHIYVYSLLFWQDCVNSMALPIVVYIRQGAMDALVGSVIFIVRPDGVRVAIDNGIYWSALNVDGCWAREAGFWFWKYLSWCIRHLHVHRDWITMSLQTPDVASVWGPTQFLYMVPRRGDSETWGLAQSCLTRQ